MPAQIDWECPKCGGQLDPDSAYDSFGTRYECGSCGRTSPERFVPEPVDMLAAARGVWHQA